MRLECRKQKKVCAPSPSVLDDCLREWLFVLTFKLGSALSKGNTRGTVLSASCFHDVKRRRKEGRTLELREFGIWG